MASTPLGKLDFVHFSLYSPQIPCILGTCTCEETPWAFQGSPPVQALVCPPQMLLEKLNGTVPCLLDTSTIPAEELTMGAPRSAANPGLSESLATSTPRTSNGDSPSHPYHRTFSPHFHHFVEQCLQRSPDVRYTCGAGSGLWGALEGKAELERMHQSPGSPGKAWVPQGVRAPPPGGSAQGLLGSSVGGAGCFLGSRGKDGRPWQ